MTPFFFGDGARRLFGAYEPATDGGSRARAALICAPWGPEHITAHLSLRRLAGNLSARGLHTLRFDYFATGDSAGETEEGDLEGWREDIEAAIDELKSMADATKVTLIGLRVGATLAAEIAARRKDVESLVLWDPVVSGPAYLAELRSLHGEFLHERTRYSRFMRTDVPNLCCHPLPSNVEAQLNALDLVALAPALRQKILFVVTQNAAAFDAVLTSLAEQGRLTVEHVGDRPPWLQDKLGFGGATPNEALKKITAWMT